MMQDLKLSLKLLKYGFQSKMQIGFMIVFVALGVFIEFVTSGRYFLGAFFIVMAPMYVSQLLYGLCMSQMVSSSPYKRRIQTSMPAVGNAFLSVICMTVVVVIHGILLKLHPEYEQAIVYLLFLAGLMNLIFNVYCATVYKYYLVSMIILMVPLVIFSGASGATMAMEGGAFGMQYFHWLTFGSATIMAYIFVAIGAVLQYLLSCAIYRKPLSEYAQGMMMRKAMKN